MAGYIRELLEARVKSEPVEKIAVAALTISDMAKAARHFVRLVRQTGLAMLCFIPCTARV